VNQLRKTRQDAFIGCYKELLDSGLLTKGDFYIDAILLQETIAHYLSDVEVLKLRYKISNRIQLPKIAGMMVNSVMKYRPIIFNKGSERSKKLLHANCIFAIYHGISICCEFSLGRKDLILRDFVGNKSFARWFNNFAYLLQSRNYTSEALIQVFETFCLFAAPEALEIKSD